MSKVHNHARRRRLLLGGMVLGACLVVGRGIQLQVVDGARWSAKAADQQRQQVSLPAPRGTIYDRNGIPLAASQVTYRIAIAPRELRDRDAVVELLRFALGLSASEARRAVDPRRRWVVLPGRFDILARQKLEGERGIYFEQVLDRFHPHMDVALEVLGGITSEGHGAGGVELAFDSVLRGRPGLAVRRRDARGEVIPGSLLPVIEPVAGHDVYLTIDQGLQEIAHDALRQAVAQTGALGGELLLADPRTGEILAAASRHMEGGAQWRATLDPYEPGSTLKPFFVAALLSEGRATLGDSIFAENGRFTHNGRTVSDTRGYGWLTLKEALNVSSNVAMVKLSERLPAAAQYRYLRDFGFGSPTGVSYPSEAAGVLRRPTEWSRYSPGSLAIGYEISVTPLQVVMAYGALANDGILMEPRLVREIRSRDGRVVKRFPPRAVRRVVSPEVAKAVSAALVDVVEAGTGRQAGLGTFQVAGKTGTARRFTNGRYDGGHTASFAGFFPAVDPQLVFLVKLDRPQGAYYGGAAAAPVTRATLAAALAARTTALDRRVVAASMAERKKMEQLAAGEEKGGASGSDGASTAGLDRWMPPASGPFIFALDGAAPRRYQPVSQDAPRPVPDVRGTSVRDAVRRLHSRGFRVEIDGGGSVSGTVPSAGVMAVPGTVVRIQAREVR